jgi:outer membrane usher protein FimD/PapC
MKLSFHTSQHLSPGYTSLALGIAYTDGVLDEEQVSRAIQLGIDSVIRSLSQSVIRNSSSRQATAQGREQILNKERDSLDKVLEQILCEGSHLSTV